VAWSVLASLLLHVVLLGVATWWPRQPPPAPAETPGVAVDFITGAEYAAETAPPAPASVPAAPPELPAPAAPPAPSAPSSPAPVAGMIRPTKMLSALALADPRAAQAAKELAHFNGEERAVQLCNLEAIEQIRTWSPRFRPERIIAYATAEEVTAGDTIRAPGAAFLSGGAWYELNYECVLSPGRAVVDGFQFKVGDAIPRAEWDADNLPTAK
jgi:hypothetical protein